LRFFRLGDGTVAQREIEKPPPELAVKKAEQHFAKLQLTVPQIGSSLYTQKAEASVNKLRNFSDENVRPIIILGADLRLKELGLFSKGNVEPALKPALELIPTKVAAYEEVKKLEKRLPEAPTAAGLEMRQIAAIKQEAEGILKRAKPPLKASEEEKKRFEVVQKATKAVLYELEGRNAAKKPDIQSAEQLYRIATTLEGVNQQIATAGKSKSSEGAVNIYKAAFDAVQNNDLQRANALKNCANLYLATKDAPEKQRAQELAIKIHEAPKLQNARNEIIETGIRLEMHKLDKAKGQDLKRARETYALSAELYRTGRPNEGQYATALAGAYADSARLGKAATKDTAAARAYIEGQISELKLLKKGEKLSILAGVKTGADLQAFWEKKYTGLASQTTVIAISAFKSKFSEARKALGKSIDPLIASAVELYTEAAKGRAEGKISEERYRVLQQSSEKILTVLTQEAELRRLAKKESGKLGAEALGAAGRYHDAAMKLLEIKKSSEEGKEASPKEMKANLAASGNLLVAATEAGQAARQKIGLEQSRRARLKNLDGLAQRVSGIDAELRTIEKTYYKGKPQYTDIFQTSSYLSRIDDAKKKVVSAKSEAEMAAAALALSDLPGTQTSPGEMAQKKKQAEQFLQLDRMAQRLDSLAYDCGTLPTSGNKRGAGYLAEIITLSSKVGDGEYGNQRVQFLKGDRGLKDEVLQVKSQLEQLHKRVEALSEKARLGKLDTKEAMQEIAETKNIIEAAEVRARGWSLQLRAVQESATSDRYATMITGGDVRKEQLPEFKAMIASSKRFLEAAENSRDVARAGAERAEKKTEFAFQVKGKRLLWTGGTNLAAGPGESYRPSMDEADRIMADAFTRRGSDLHPAFKMLAAEQLNLYKLSLSGKGGREWSDHVNHNMEVVLTAYNLKGDKARGEFYDKIAGRFDLAKQERTEAGADFGSINRRFRDFLQAENMDLKRDQKCQEIVDAGRSAIVFAVQFINPVVGMLAWAGDFAYTSLKSPEFDYKGAALLAGAVLSHGLTNVLGATIRTAEEGGLITGRMTQAFLRGYSGVAIAAGFEGFYEAVRETGVPKDASSAMQLFIAGTNAFLPVYHGARARLELRRTTRNANALDITHNEMSGKGAGFDAALKRAQELGFKGSETEFRGAYNYRVLQDYAKMDLVGPGSVERAHGVAKREGYSGDIRQFAQDINQVRSEGRARQQEFMPGAQAGDAVANERPEAARPATPRAETKPAGPKEVMAELERRLGQAEPTPKELAAAREAKRREMTPRELELERIENLTKSDIENKNISPDGLRSVAESRRRDAAEYRKKAEDIRKEADKYEREFGKESRGYRDFVDRAASNEEYARMYERTATALDKAADPAVREVYVRLTPEQRAQYSTTELKVAADLLRGGLRDHFIKESIFAPQLMDGVVASYLEAGISAGIPIERIGRVVEVGLKGEVKIQERLAAVFGTEEARVQMQENGKPNLFKNQIADNEFVSALHSITQDVAAWNKMVAEVNKRYGTNIPENATVVLDVCMFDGNNGGKVNAAAGRGAGDIYIQKLFEIVGMDGLDGKNSIAIRMGGDEGGAFGVGLKSGRLGISIKYGDLAGKHELFTEGSVNGGIVKLELSPGMAPGEVRAKLKQARGRADEMAAAVSQAGYKGYVIREENFHVETLEPGKKYMINGEEKAATTHGKKYTFTIEGEPRPIERVLEYMPREGLFTPEGYKRAEDIYGGHQRWRAEKTENTYNPNIGLYTMKGGSLHAMQEGYRTATSEGRHVSVATVDMRYPGQERAMKHLNDTVKDHDLVNRVLALRHDLAAEIVATRPGEPIRIGDANVTIRTFKPGGDTVQLIIESDRPVPKEAINKVLSERLRRLDEAQNTALKGDFAQSYSVAGVMHVEKSSGIGFEEAVYKSKDIAMDSAKRKAMPGENAVVDYERGQVFASLIPKVQDMVEGTVFGILLKEPGQRNVYNIELLRQLGIDSNVPKMTAVEASKTVEAAKPEIVMYSRENAPMLVRESYISRSLRQNGIDITDHPAFKVSEAENFARIQKKPDAERSRMENEYLQRVSRPAEAAPSAAPRPEAPPSVISAGPVRAAARGFARGLVETIGGGAKASVVLVDLAAAGLIEGVSQAVKEVKTSREIRSQLNSIDWNLGEVKYLMRAEGNVEMPNQKTLTINGTKYYVLDSRQEGAFPFERSGKYRLEKPSILRRAEEQLTKAGIDIDFANIIVSDIRKNPGDRQKIYEQFALSGDQIKLINHYEFQLNQVARMAEAAPGVRPEAPGVGARPAAPAQKPIPIIAESFERAFGKLKARPDLEAKLNETAPRETGERNDQIRKVARSLDQALLEPGTQNPIADPSRLSPEYRRAHDALEGSRDPASLIREATKIVDERSRAAEAQKPAPIIPEQMERVFGKLKGRPELEAKLNETAPREGGERNNQIRQVARSLDQVLLEPGTQNPIADPSRLSPEYRRAHDALEGSRDTASIIREATKIVDERIRVATPEMPAQKAAERPVTRGSEVERLTSAMAEFDSNFQKGYALAPTPEITGMMKIRDENPGLSPKQVAEVYVQRRKVAEAKEAEPLRSAMDTLGWKDGTPRYLWVPPEVGQAAVFPKNFQNLQSIEVNGKRYYVLTESHPGAVMHTREGPTLRKSEAPRPEAPRVEARAAAPEIPVAQKGAERPVTRGSEVERLTKAMAEFDSNFQKGYALAPTPEITGMMKIRDENPGLSPKQVAEVYVQRRKVAEAKEAEPLRSAMDTLGWKDGTPRYLWVPPEVGQAAVFPKNFQNLQSIEVNGKRYYVLTESHPGAIMHTREGPTLRKSDAPRPEAPHVEARPEAPAQKPAPIIAEGFEGAFGKLKGRAELEAKLPRGGERDEQVRKVARALDMALIEPSTQKPIADPSRLPPEYRSAHNALKGSREPDAIIREAAKIVDERARAAAPTEKPAQRPAPEAQAKRIVSDAEVNNLVAESRTATENAYTMPMDDIRFKFHDSLVAKIMEKEGIPLHKVSRKKYLEYLDKPEAKEVARNLLEAPSARPGVVGAYLGAYGKVLGEKPIQGQIPLVGVFATGVKGIVAGVRAAREARKARKAEVEKAATELKQHDQAVKDGRPAAPAPEVQRMLEIREKHPKWTQERIAKRLIKDQTKEAKAAAKLEAAAKPETKEVEVARPAQVQMTADSLLEMAKEATRAPTAPEKVALSNARSVAEQMARDPRYVEAASKGDTTAQRAIAEEYSQLGRVADSTVATIERGAYVDVVKNARQVVAFGDVHANAVGLADQMVKNGTLIDKRSDLAREDISVRPAERYALNPDLPAGTQLVGLGDFVDRGPASIEVIDLVRAIQKQAEARKDGTAVHALRGNHEEIFLKFFEKYEKLSTDQARDRATTSEMEWEEVRSGVHWKQAGFDKTFESIIKKYGSWEKAVKEMKKDGTIDFMRSTRGMVIIDNVGFTHAGPVLGASTPQALDAYYKSLFENPNNHWRYTSGGIKFKMEAVDKHGDYSYSAVGRPDFPATAKSSGDNWVLDPRFQEWRKGLGLDQLVVGHAMEKETGRPMRYGDNVINLDVGMYKGGSGTLIIDPINRDSPVRTVRGRETEPTAVDGSFSGKDRSRVLGNQLSEAAAKVYGAEVQQPARTSPPAAAEMEALAARPEKSSEAQAVLDKWKAFEDVRSKIQKDNMLPQMQSLPHDEIMAHAETPEKTRGMAYKPAAAYKKAFNDLQAAREALAKAEGRVAEAPGIEAAEQPKAKTSETTKKPDAAERERIGIALEDAQLALHRLKEKNAPKAEIETAQNKVDELSRQLPKEGAVTGKIEPKSFGPEAAQRAAAERELGVVTVTKEKELPAGVKVEPLGTPPKGSGRMTVERMAAEIAREKAEATPRPETPAFRVEEKVNNYVKQAVGLDLEQRGVRAEIENRYGKRLDEKKLDELANGKYESPQERKFIEKNKDLLDKYGDLKNKYEGAVKEATELQKGLLPETEQRRTRIELEDEASSRVTQRIGQELNKRTAVAEAYEKAAEAAGYPKEKEPQRNQFIFERRYKNALDKWQKNREDAVRDLANVAQEKQKNNLPLNPRDQAALEWRRISEQAAPKEAAVAPVAAPGVVRAAPKLEEWQVEPTKPQPQPGVRAPGPQASTVEEATRIPKPTNGTQLLEAAQKLTSISNPGKVIEGYTRTAETFEINAENKRADAATKSGDEKTKLLIEARDYENRAAANRRVADGMEILWFEIDRSARLAKENPKEAKSILEESRVRQGRIASEWEAMDLGARQAENVRYAKDSQTLKERQNQELGALRDFARETGRDVQKLEGLYGYGTTERKLRVLRELGISDRFTNNILRIDELRKSGKGPEELKVREAELEKAVDHLFMLVTKGELYKKISALPGYEGATVAGASFFPGMIGAFKLDLTLPGGSKRSIFLKMEDMSATKLGTDYAEAVGIVSPKVFASDAYAYQREYIDPRTNQKVIETKRFGFIEDVHDMIGREVTMKLSDGAFRRVKILDVELVSDIFLHPESGSSVTQEFNRLAATSEGRQQIFGEWRAYHAKSFRVLEMDRKFPNTTGLRYETVDSGPKKSGIAFGAMDLGGNGHHIVANEQTGSPEFKLFNVDYHRNSANFLLDFSKTKMLRDTVSLGSLYGEMFGPVAERGARLGPEQGNPRPDPPEVMARLNQITKDNDGRPHGLGFDEPTMQGRSLAADGRPRFASPDGHLPLFADEHTKLLEAARLEEPGFISGQRKGINIRLAILLKLNVLQGKYSKPGEPNFELAQRIRQHPDWGKPDQQELIAQRELERSMVK